MSRPQVTIRKVDPRCPSELFQVWNACRVEFGVITGRGRSPEPALRAALESGEMVGFVAMSPEGPLGYALCTAPQDGLFVEGAHVSIEQLFVVPGYRRTGIARSLLATVAAYAERNGVEQVVSHVPAADRDVNRFYARLGFTSAVIRRVTSTTALRRRLAAEDDRARFVVLDRVLQRRRLAQVRSTARAAQPIAR